MNNLINNHRVLSIILCIIMVLTVLPLQAFALDLPDNYTLANNESAVLAPGITQNKSVIYKPDGKRIEVFTATADLSVDTVQIAANYKDNQFSNYGMQILSEQVSAAERKHAEPYNVIAAVNASHYNMETGYPEGCFIMDGNVIKDTGGYAFFAILKDGTPVIGYGREYNNYKGNIQQGLSGSLVLIKDGRINSTDGQTIDNGTYNVINPRTTIGITADNKVIVMVVDGRNEPVSAGTLAYEQAEMMLELGCVQAMNFDGGGSSTFGSKEPGKDFKIQNNPSDGSERAISTSLMFISTAEPTGEFDHAYLDCDYKFLTGGTSVKINPIGLDINEKDAPLPQSGLTWSVSDSSLGYVDQNGEFTASSYEGTLKIYLDYNGRRVGEKELSIVMPDSIKFSKKKINVPYDSDILMPISGYINGIPVAINENDFIAVHEYEYNESVHESLLDNYGYFNGMYFHTPAEEMGIRAETLYMIPAFAEDESYISTLKLEFYNEGEEYFDYDNATVKTDNVSWYRNVSNSTTNDDLNYKLINNTDPVFINYKFGLEMDEMELPSELQSMWDAFSSALGDNIWAAFLRLANKIDPATNVTIEFTLDENVSIADLSSIRLVSDLFVLDRNEITYNTDTNTVKFVMRWNQDYVNESLASEEGLTPDTVSPTVIADNIKLALNDGVDLSSASGLTIINSFKVSYSFIAVSASAYGIVSTTPELAAYAYEDGNKRGMCFSTTYIDTNDSFRLFEADETTDGWIGNSYYVNGVAVTGINIVPSKDGEASYYYDFDENGECLGKYTGIVEQGDDLFYSEDGKLTFAGLIMTDNGDCYYFGENLAASNGRSVYVKKTNGLCAEGTYNLLGDKRVILNQTEEVLLYTNYTEALNDCSIISAPPSSAVVTTGTQIVCYRNGIMTTKTVAKFGDVDGDAVCDGRDSVMILCILNGMITSENLSAAQLKAADCDKNGTITENDYNLCVSSGLMMVEISQNPPIY
ncbi:MAG: phosphodiester glycosidase family protein [Clostridia bacterium]|nr:phosphodiester glycosidase family protein [Clostridia bacterium]